MNTRDMDCFCTITREKSITKASKVLYMSPQGLSKIIKNIENELGAKLLIRTSSGIELTESGQCFYEKVSKILSDYRDMKNDILHIEQRDAGVIDLISSNGILRLLTPECVSQFCKKYPEIEFTYREYPDREVERKFQKKDGNVAFAIGPFEEELYEKVKLASCPIKLLVHENHPLACRETVSIEDIRGERLFIESSEFKIHHFILRKCYEAGFHPDIAFETSGFSLCHKMCKEQKGISVTLDFISADMSMEHLVCLPFAGEGYEWNVYMLTRKGEPITAEMKLFHRHVNMWLRNIQEGIITR